MKLTVTWRETAERSSTLDLPDGLTRKELAGLAYAHAARLSAVAGACEEVKGVAWETDEPNTRIGAKLG